MCAAWAVVVVVGNLASVVWLLVPAQAAPMSFGRPQDIHGMLGHPDDIRRTSSAAWMESLIENAQNGLLVVTKGAVCLKIVRL